MVTANDFVSRSLCSVWNIWSLRFRTLRWVNERTLLLNRWLALSAIVLYYYI